MCSSSKIFDMELRKDFLYEWLVQEHLFRKFGSVHYHKNSCEIDCMAENLKVEVKAGKPHRRYLKDVLILDEENMASFLAGL